MSSMTIAQLQTHVFSDKMQNIEALRPLIQKAKNSGADLVCLPEMFNCPYETPNFPVYAEKAGGPVWQALSDLAKEFGIYFSPDPSRNVTRTDMFSIPPMSLTEVESRLPATEKSTSSTLM